MKPSDVAKALITCLDAKQPVCLWGSPGIGKSQIVHQTGILTNREVRDVRAVLLDPVDLRGLPHVNGDGRSHWATPEFLPRDGQGIFFLDELNRAVMMVQNACFQLVLDGKLGEYTMPPEWRIVAACNHGRISVEHAVRVHVFIDSCDCAITVISCWQVVCFQVFEN